VVIQWRFIFATLTSKKKTGQTKKVGESEDLFWIAKVSSAFPFRYFQSLAEGRPENGELQHIPGYKPSPERRLVPWDVLKLSVFRTAFREGVRSDVEGNRKTCK
jgi:hypothetical protein